MRKKITIFLVFCILLSVRAQTKPDLSQFILLKKGFQQNQYSTQEHFTVFNFTIVEPGIALLPIGGGIHMAGWKRWLIPPTKNSTTYGIDYIKADSTLYFMRASSTKSSLVKLIDDGTKKSYEKVLELPLGVYGFKCFKSDVIYIWTRQNNISKVWLYNLKELIPVFESEKTIRELVVINESEILIAADNSLIRLGLYYAPFEVLKLDLNIDGLATTNDGSLYVSTENGILHYLSPDDISDAEVITFGIHGVLRRYRDSLFVLWEEDNQILEIHLK